MGCTFSCLEQEPPAAGLAPPFTPTMAGVPDPGAVGTHQGVSVAKDTKDVGHTHPLSPQGASSADGPAGAEELPVPAHR